jgi:hypothetical protein
MAKASENNTDCWHSFLEWNLLAQALSNQRPDLPADYALTGRLF